jgi:hypothetical protein
VKDFVTKDGSAGDDDGERVMRRRKKMNFAHIVVPKLCHFVAVAVVIGRQFPWAILEVALWRQLNVG